MLTIGQLAAHTGVTIRAVRHYHKMGLLPEPERDRSGYRRYGAAAVVRLIRIRTLASAGVPLTRVQELLDADPDEFRRDVGEIDRRLRAEIKRLQRTRTRLARLATGDQLALPQSVVGYLDRLRGLGVVERYVAMARDAWIMIAAQVPDRIDEWIAYKHRELDDPEMVSLYRLLGGALEWAPDDPRVIEVTDILERQLARAVRTGYGGDEVFDHSFVDLLDSVTLESSPVAARALALLEERGWRGWTRIERAPTERLEG